MNSGNSWAIQCGEQEVGDKMVVDVDITKYRVQPFKSYKVCCSLSDSPTSSFLPRVCTHLFSFEQAVPYVPEEVTTQTAIDKRVFEDTLIDEEESELNSVLEDIVSEGDESEQKRVIENTISDEETSELQRVLEGIVIGGEERENTFSAEEDESELMRVLGDTKDFVSDDFRKVETRSLGKEESDPTHSSSSVITHVSWYLGIMALWGVCVIH